MKRAYRRLFEMRPSPNAIRIKSAPPVSACAGAGICISLNYDKLPFITRRQGVHGVLRRGGRTGDQHRRQVSGSRVGRVSIGRPRRPAGAGQVHVSQRRSAGRPHRGGDQIEDPAWHQAPRDHPARRRPADQTDTAGADHLGLSVARCAGRSFDDHQRLNTDQLSTSLAVLADDVLQHPTATQGRGERCGAVLPDTGRARQAIAEPAGQRQ